MKTLIETLNWQQVPWPKSSFTLPKLQAHRGYWVEGARENTMDAFAAAKGKGYGMFECDVQLTKDRVPVLFHDSTIARFAPPHFASPQLAISQLSFPEYKELRLGPSLQEVLLSQDRPELVNIELKTKALFDSSFEQALAKVVRETKNEDKVMVSSFNPFAILKCSYEMPMVPRALLATTQKEPGNYWFLRKLLLAPCVQTHLLHLCHEDWSEGQIGSLADKGLGVALWTVNDPVRAQRYLKNGAVSIISDSVSAFQAAEGRPEYL